MKLSVLVLITALAVGLSIGIVNYYFQHSWYYLGVSFAISFGTSFLVFYYLFEKYIYTKIKLIYKLITDSKREVNIKDLAYENIETVNMHVMEWAETTKKELIQSASELISKEVTEDKLDTVLEDFRIKVVSLQEAEKEKLNEARQEVQRIKDKLQELKAYGIALIENENLSLQIAQELKTIEAQTGLKVVYYECNFTPKSATKTIRSIKCGVARNQITVIGNVAGEQRAQALDVVTPIAMQFAGDTEPGHQLRTHRRHPIPG